MTLIEKAIAALSADYGPNWHKKVNVDTLNMQDPRCCILGQASPVGWVSSTHPERPCRQLTREEYHDAFCGGEGGLTTQQWRGAILDLRAQASTPAADPQLDVVEIALIKQLLAAYDGPHTALAQQAFAKL